MESLEGLNNYHNAAYIRMPYIDRDVYRDTTRRAADFYGWKYHEIDGSMSLMERPLIEKKAIFDSTDRSEERTVEKKNSLFW